MLAKARRGDPTVALWRSDHGLVGTLGDGGQTVEQRRSALGFGPASVGLVFVDHAKEASLPDLRRILE